MVDWLEISLAAQDGEAAEAIVEVLQRYGHQGVAIEQADVPAGEWDDGAALPPQKLIVRAYIPNDNRAPEARKQLETSLGHMSLMYPMPTPVYMIVHEEDWAEAWKAHYHPMKVGRHMFIRPPWALSQPEPDDLVITLDPGMAFGTGTHPTTKMCLMSLEDLVEPGMSVLDLGCGSGILSIGAVKLGAAHVLGVDIDPIAVEVTLNNATVNDCADKISAEEGSLENLVSTGRQFDLVVANILAYIIIRMCDKGLGGTVRPGGRAIFSGIILDQADAVEAALRETGLQPTARRLETDWVVIEATRPEAS